MRRRALTWTSTIFAIGDRVLITNKITHALRGEPGSNTNQVGIVQRITEHRVYLLTLAGTYTCRARKNQQLIKAHANT